MSPDEEAEQGQLASSSESVAVRLLAALLVKGEPKPAAATRLLNLGVSVSDIARVLEIKPASVRVIKHRAKARISETKDAGPEPAAPSA